MSDTIANLTYQQTRRNEYLIDEAAMDERRSQSFRRDACIFAGMCGIALQDKRQAHAFFKYYRSHGKVESLLRKAAKKFGHGEPEIARAIAIIRKDFRMPDDLAAARIMLSYAKEQIATEKLGLPSPAGNTESSGMFRTEQMLGEDVQRLAKQSMKTGPAQAQDSKPAAPAPEAIKYATPFSIIPPAVSGKPVVPRQSTMEQLAKELEDPAPKHRAHEPTPATRKQDEAGHVSGAAIPHGPAEKKAEEKTGFQKPKDKQEKRAYRLLRYVARKNDFTEDELRNAMGLCRKYQWYPRAPRIAIRKKTKERREELRSQAFDLLSQARMGYGYIDSIGRSSLPEGDTGSRATRNVKERYSHYGQRIVSDEVRQHLGNEYKFLSDPAKYVSAYGGLKNYPIRAIMEVKGRISGRVIPGSRWELSGKSPLEAPDVYSRRLLELAKGGIGEEITCVSKCAPLADRASKANNFNLINLACREEHQQTGGGRTYSVEVQKLAQRSSEARGTIFASQHDAHTYLERARRYADAEASRPILSLIKQAAKKFGFDKEEAEAALRLSREHLSVPTDTNEAGDFLLQARLASQGRLSDYIWGIAQDGLYPYGVALEVERRYTANTAPLTREQAIAMLNDETEFQEDPYTFAAKVAKTVVMEAGLGSIVMAPSPSEPHVVALGYTLSQFLNGKVDQRISPDLLRLHRGNQAHALLTHPAYRAVLGSKWEEYCMAQMLVKKAAEEYSKLVPVDMDAGKAVVEALRRVHDDGENPRNLTQAISLFRDTLWQVKNKSVLQSRVKRNLITQEVADDAWARILPQRREFGSIDEEIAFYAGICEERGAPYPAKLLAYLHYHAGKISRDVAQAAIAKLDMDSPDLRGGEEALAFIAFVESSFAPKEAAAKAPAPQKFVYRPSPHRKADPHESTAYANTVLGGNGGAAMFKMAEAPVPPAQGGEGETAPQAEPPDSEKADKQAIGSKARTIQQVPPIRSFATPFQHEPVPLSASRRIAGGKAAAPESAHPDSLHMAGEAKGRTIQGPALPAPATLPDSVAVQTEKDKGGILGPDGKMRPLDQWATMQRPAPTVAQIADELAAKKPAPEGQPQPAGEKAGDAERPHEPDRVSQPSSSVSSSDILEEVHYGEGSRASEAPAAPQPEPTPDDITEALAQKAAQLKAEEIPADEARVLSASDQMATMQRPAPTKEEIEAALAAKEAPDPSTAPAQAAEPAAPQATSQPAPSPVSSVSDDLEAAFGRISLVPSGATIPAPPPMGMLELERAIQPPQRPQDPDADHAEVLPISKLEAAAHAKGDGAPADAGSDSPSEEHAAPDAPSPSSPTMMISPAQQEELVAESKEARDSRKDELRTMHYARRLYHSRDPAKRMEAVDELARMGSPAALYALAGALGQNEDVSALAASVLLSYHEEALFSLASVLEEGSDSGKSRAISILVQIGSQGAYDTLARALLDDEYGICGEAAFRLLLAHSTGVAETRRHFHSIPEAKSLYLLESMLSGLHPASDLEAVVLRAESAEVLAGLLEAKPWLAQSVKPDTWMQAIEEWAKEGTGKSLSATARALGSTDEKVCSEAAFHLLLSTAEGKADNSIPLLEHYFHNPDLPQKISSVARRRMGPEADVPALVEYYFTRPNLQPLMVGLLRACDPAKAIPLALSRNRVPERNLDHDLAIKQLLQEAYGSTSMEHVADCAAREYSAATAGGDRDSIRAAAEEAHFLISILPGDSPKEHSLRFLEASLQLLPSMDTAQKTGTCDFARRMESDALPLLLAHVRAESKSGRSLGNETIGMLVPLIAHIGRKEGIEFFENVLPEAAGMGGQLLGALADLALKLDPVRAEAMVLDHVNGMALSSRLSKETILAMVSIEDKIAPRTAGPSGSKYCAGAELLSYALPMLNGMASEERQKVGHFAMNRKAGSLPFILGYVESEAKAGRRLGAENVLLLSAIVDYIGEKEGVELLGYVLPEISSLEGRKLNDMKDILALDHERAERILLDYAAARHSTAQLSRREVLVIMELAAEIARHAELSKEKTSCAEFFGYAIPWLQEFGGEELELARAIYALDPAAAERALVAYAKDRASNSQLSKEELFSLMALEYELSGLVACSGGRSGGAELLAVALPMLRGMGMQEATNLAYFASSENIKAGAAKHIETHINGFNGRTAIPKDEFAAVALMLARIGDDKSFALLSRLFEEENTEIMRAMQDALAAHYGAPSEDGAMPVRETLLRAALGKKTEGKKCRDQKEEISNLGTVAFEIIIAQRDSARDVIEGCKEAHLCAPEDAKRASRMLQAQELLVKIGDDAIRDLSEGVFSEDLSQYPAFYKANLLKTVAQMAGRSEKTETKELAKGCLMKAVSDFRLGEDMVGGALGTIKINVVKELAMLLLPDPSGSIEMEKRAVGILANMGPQVHAEMGQMLSSRDSTQHRCAALAVRALLSREKGPADALKANPQFQANLDALPRMLLDQDNGVRAAAESTLAKFWPHVSLYELERATRLRRGKYSDMLPYQDEVSQRRKAASLLSMRGEPAIGHFLAIINDPGLNQDVVRACIDASVLIGEGMLEKLVEAASERGISDKFYLLHSSARCDSPMGRFLTALFNHSSDWDVLMKAAEIGPEFEVPQWKSLLLQWFVVEGVVLRRDEMAAEAASWFVGFAGSFGMDDLARDFKEAVDAKVELCGWSRDDAVSLSNVDILEKKELGLDTSSIRAEFGKTPGPGDPSYREKYRGFVRQRSRMQPPPLPKKLTAQNGGNGGPAGGRF